MTVKNHKRIVRGVLLALVPLLAFNALRHHKLGPWAAYAQTTSLTSMTVYQKEILHDSAGKVTAQNYYTRALRPDGSRVWRIVTDRTQERRIFAANGDVAVLNEKTGRVTTYPKAEPAQALSPSTFPCPAAHLDSFSVEKEEDILIGGATYHTTKLVSKPPTDPRQKAQKMTQWVLPEFGCQSIQLQAEEEGAVTEQIPTAIIYGDPDPSLFQVPASFKETPPSLRNCETSQPCVEALSAARQDARYHKLRQQAGLE